MKYSANYDYDIECYPNFFSIRFTRDTDGGKWCFEISEWMNQGRELNFFLNQLKQSKARMVGYNNLGYDYPMVHTIMDNYGNVNHTMLYAKSRAIFEDRKYDQFAHSISDWNTHIAQVDLFKIHHFDNKAKMTSLKLLEFNMRMDDIQELPYDPLLPVTREQADHLLSYNDHDVFATGKFREFTANAIAFRDDLSETYGKDFTNHNDTRIGADIVMLELAKHGVSAHKSIQTIRSKIVVNDIILPYIKFESEEFNKVLTFFRGSVMDPEKIKGFFKNNAESEETSFTSATINGFTFDFGAGGIHGSVSKEIIIPNDDEELIDSDVASYYPNISIKNKISPAHLGDGWCVAMEFMFNERLRVGKKTAMGGAYKLGLNGGYGKSNDKHSPFFDSQYTMAITINGQLLLCMLAEQLMKIPGLRMVQVNTDGLTYVCPKFYVQHAMSISTWWEGVTDLELEHVNYSKMCIRDVNSYIAVKTDGSVKRIGAYAYLRVEENESTRELPWHKNHGGIVIAKAAEAALVRGENIEQFIRNHVTVDHMDFMFRTKVPRSAELFLETPVKWGDDMISTDSRKLANISRYFISNSGGALIKVMAPTEKQCENWLNTPHWRHKKTGAHKCSKKAPSGMWEQIPRPSDVPPDRRIGIEAGKHVTECNRMTEEFKKLPDVNIAYYVERTRKLVDELVISTVQ